MVNRVMLLGFNLALKVKQLHKARRGGLTTHISEDVFSSSMCVKWHKWNYGTCDEAGKKVLPRHWFWNAGMRWLLLGIAL